MHKIYQATKAVWGTASRLYAVAMRHIGLPFVYGGVAALALFYLTGLSNYNILNFLAVMSIFLGTVGYVKGEKRKSVY